MISALLYLLACSFRNRLVARFKRLKQPKYLIGAIVGGLYFYFYFFRFLFHARPTSSSWNPNSAEYFTFYQSVGALILCVIVLLAWIIPHERAALTFTEAEVAFLFPAPITRKGLIHFKLLRSQLRIFFTTFLLVLIFRRSGSHLWIRAAGWWLILSTLNLHFIGSSFARTLLLDRGISNRQRRLGILVILLAVGVGAFVWIQRTIPNASSIPFGDFPALSDYILQVLQSGPIPYVLYPFRLIVRPYLSQDAVTFLLAAGPAFIVLLLHYAWVVWSDVSFEEASVDASRRFAEKIAAARAGRSLAGGKKLKAKRPPFTLAPTGFAPVALLWKNLIHAGQAFTARIWITVIALVVGCSIGLRQGTGPSGLLPTLGMFAGILLIWSLIIGPQVVRQDLRQDILCMDVLKGFPMPGWQMALGELLAPAVILTAIQWCLLIIAATFIPGETGPGSQRPVLASACGAAVICPVLNLISLQIPNAAVLLFPAWFQIGKDSGRGIEVTGQRLIAMLCQLLVFIVTIAPAAAVFGLVFFFGRLLLNLNATIPLACIAAALVLATEAGLGMMLLGRLFERFDLSLEMDR